MVNNTVNAGGLELLAAPSRSANRSERANDRSFDSFLAPREDVARQSERPVRADGQRENRDSGTRGGQPVARTAAALVQTEQTMPEEEMAAIMYEQQDTPISEMAEYVLEDFDMALTLLEEEVLEEIASVLGITPQALAEILNALGMTPADLQETQAQTELLQLLHGLDDEVALLNIPAVLPIMQEISKTMEKYAPVLLEYQAQVYKQPQYAAVAEISPADLGLQAKPDSELAPMEQPVQRDAPKANTPADHNAAETVVAVAKPMEGTATANAEPLQSLEPIVAFAQETQQPVGNFVRSAPVEAPVPQAPINPQNVMEQITQNMRFEMRGNIAEVRIHLKPEHLGEVKLRIAMQNGIVVAQFVAESQRVKEIIESNFSQLRDSLEEQGINVSEIEVSVSQGEADRQFGFEGNISGDRIRDIMEGDEDEAVEEIKLEENLVDYLA